MKKLILCMVMVTLISSASNAVAWEWKVDQITNNGIDDYFPTINSGGQVAWSGGVSVAAGDYRKGPTFEIYLYDGNTSTQITNNLYADYDAFISDNGNVVWSSLINGQNANGDIFIYDGAIKQISNSSVDSKRPYINASGHVVFEEGPIMFYNGSVTAPVPNSSGIQGRISDNGNIAWRSSSGGIKYYDAVKKTTISLPNPTSGSADEYPWINAAGDLVWGKGDIASYDYSSGTVSAIPSSPYVDFYPMIGDNGNIVFPTNDGQRIYYYDALTGLTAMIADYGIGNSFDDVLTINSSGKVAWAANDENNWDIFFYDGKDVYNVTNSPNYDERSPVLNDFNDITWHAYDGNDYEIFKAKAIVIPGAESVVPEPATMTLFGIGLLGVGAIKRRKG